MRRTFKFRVYPTSKQQDALGMMLRAHCELYNAALQERRDAWQMNRVSVNIASQMTQLKAIREARPDHAGWSFTSQQQTLRRLDKTFTAFFRRLKAGEKAGYPRFRSVRRFDSVDFRHGNGIRFRTEGCALGRARLYVMGVGEIKVRMHRNLPDGAKLGQVTVKREGSGPRARWFVVLPVEVVAEPLPATGSQVGVDMGVTHFLTTSDGLHEPNPRHGRKAAERLAVAQRDLARKKRGSNRRRKAVERVAALHRTVADQRRDFHHKTAVALVRDHDLIAVEALRISNMTRAAKPVPDPDKDGAFLPNGAAAKSGLNRSILDAGWGCFLDVLRAKAESAGRVIVEVNPRDTSRTCHACGHCSADSRSDEAFACVACGHVAHADVNAARNILRAGLARRDALAA